MIIYLKTKKRVRKRFVFIHVYGGKVTGEGIVFETAKIHYHVHQCNNWERSKASHDDLNELFKIISETINYEF